jgi:hypothetical protein
MASRPTRNAPPPSPPSTHESRGTQNEPRLPHERDESADSQTGDDPNAPGREVGDQAFKDLRAGRVDTDRGPVMDRLYRRNLRRTGNKDRRSR